MKDADRPQLCICGADMQRDFQADLPFTSGRDYHKAIVSDSLAINPDQMNEHQQKFPDVKVLPDGRPVFDNYKQHDDYLEKTGFKKQRQKIRKRGKRIA